MFWPKSERPSLSGSKYSNFIWMCHYVPNVPCSEQHCHCISKIRINRFDSINCICILIQNVKETRTYVSEMRISNKHIVLVIRHLGITRIKKNINKTIVEIQINLDNSLWEVQKRFDNFSIFDCYIPRIMPFPPLSNHSSSD